MALLVKNLPTNAGDISLIPGSGKIPWKRGCPSPVFLPGEFHGQRNLMGYSPWVHKEPDMTEWLTLSLFMPKTPNVCLQLQLLSQTPEMSIQTPAQLLHLDISNLACSNGSSPKSSPFQLATTPFGQKPWCHLWFFAFSHIPHYSLNYVPPKIHMLQSWSPGPHNVTTFGDSWLSSSEVISGPESNMTGVCIVSGNSDTDM